MIKFKLNDWVLTTSGCIVQVLHIDRGDYMVGVRVDANDVMRPLSKHAMVKVVPDPKKLLEAPIKLLKEVNNLLKPKKIFIGKLQKTSTKTQNRPYGKKK